MRVHLSLVGLVLVSGCSWIGGHGGKVGYRAEADFGKEVQVRGPVLKYAESADAVIYQQRYNQLFEEGDRIALRGVQTNGQGIEYTAEVNYTQAQAKANVAIGTATSPVNGTQAITASFEDYQRVGVEFGVRKVTPIAEGVRVYVGASAGVARVDSMDAVVSSAAFDTMGLGLQASNRTRVFDESWVPTAAVSVGAQWQVAPRASLGVEGSVRYDGALDGSDDALNALGVRTANDESKRISVPVMVRGRFVF